MLIARYKARSTVRFEDFAGGIVGIIQEEPQMQIEMKVINFTTHENVGQDGVSLYQARLYGSLDDHGVVLDIARATNDLNFAMEKKYLVTVEEKA